MPSSACKKKNDRPCPSTSTMSHSTSLPREYMSAFPATRSISPGGRPSVFPMFCFSCYGDHRDLHSFPTRRSSDLQALEPRCRPGTRRRGRPADTGAGGDGSDRKSTRLNSSHTVISYAVFCSKTKKKIIILSPFKKKKKKKTKKKPKKNKR